MIHICESKIRLAKENKFKIIATAAAAELHSAKVEDIRKRRSCVNDC
jgi:hypothetical protein